MTARPHLLVERNGPVLIATLNRPEKLNAISDEMMDLLAAAVDEFRTNKSLAVLLIRAEGRYFSAGADLLSGDHEVPHLGSEIREYHRQVRLMHRTYDEMEAIEKPIVIAHQAPCLGAGLELSLSCDFRLAARSAQYGFPEGNFGVLPASNGVSRLVRIVGTHWARYFVMAGLKMDADRALSIGLVHEVFEDAAFEESTMAFVQRLATRDAEQIGTAKLAIEMAADVGLAQARNVERLANSVLMLGPNYQHVRHAYLESFGRRARRP